MARRHSTVTKNGSLWAMSLLAAGLGATACGDKNGDSGEDTTGEVVDGGGTGDDSCGGTAPVISEITCQNLGLAHYEDGDYPQLLMTMAVTDDDGDLSSYSAEVYFDDTVDGTVATDSSPFDPVSGSTSSETCNTASANLGVTLVITGGRPEFDTEYEWAFIVNDAAGQSSDPYVLTCRTPKSDGTWEE